MTFYENAFEAEPGLIQRGISNRQDLLRRETEDFLRERNLAYDERAAEHWDRDYSSEAAYLESVAPNRERWLQAMGDFGPPEENMAPEIEPFAENDEFRAHWVTLSHYGSLRARAIVGVPKTGDPPHPVIICQHGVSSSPEKTFGFDDAAEIYHSYAQECLRAGFAVISPLNITLKDPRARYTRLAKLLGGTLWGLEISKISRLIDWAETRDDLDADRVGMWGISLGGAYTIFTLPIELRIKAGIICAWFNHRARKMVVEDGRHSCFLPLDAEHIWIPGMLREFSDADLVSLICPRPVMSQTGKCDGIAWWPWVLEEFERAKVHYERLGVPERIEMDLHEGGHEIRVQTGLDFMHRWL
ncbi:MAG: alpha/beta hydrolase family protein [Armatimonadota bacterium]|nr:alpha/beta hydrolase family protein [Armatimonadota bacterium]